MAGRKGITFDQVAAAADALVAEGSHPSLDAVRNRLGTGNKGTISKHMKAWADNRPKATAPAIELPPPLLSAMHAWATQMATVFRADSEERLVVALAEVDSLARESEQLEKECDDLRDEMAALTSERDKAKGTAAEQAAEILRLQSDVAREREIAGNVQVESAQTRLKIEAQTVQIEELKARTIALEGEAREQGLGRIQAEKSAAVMEAERDAARKEAGEERERIEGLRVLLAAATDAVKDAAAKERATAIENAALKERLAALEKATPVAGGQ